MKTFIFKDDTYYDDSGWEYACYNLVDPPSGWLSVYGSSNSVEDCYLCALSYNNILNIKDPKVYDIRLQELQNIATIAEIEIKIVGELE